MNNATLNASTQQRIPCTPQDSYTCRGCLITSPTLKLFKNHVRNCEKVKKKKVFNDKKIVYLCEICGKVFFTKLGLRINIYLHFPEEYLTCGGCKLTLKNYTVYIRHVRDCLKEKNKQTRNQNKNVLYCDLCGKDFLTKKGILRHIFSHFPQEYLTCEGCQKRCSNYSLYEKHARFCVKLKRRKKLLNAFKCHLCSKAFMSMNGIRDHIYSHFPEEYLTCKGCNKTLKSNNAFRTHSKSCKKLKLKISPDLGAFKCELCDKYFFNKDWMRHHIYAHFPEEYCTCSGCSEQFKSRILLRHHWRSCKKYKNKIKKCKNAIECDLCGKTYFTKHGLIKHMYAHFPEEYLTCEGCNKSHKYVYLHKRHMRSCEAFKKKTSNLKKNALKCNICKKEVFTKEGLRSHMYVHFPEEYLTCERCKKTHQSVKEFKRHKSNCSDLNKKKRTVRKNNVIKCELCAKRFSFKSQVRKHMFSHFPEEYLSCKVCKKSFIDFVAYCRHTRTCSKVMKEYKCNICNKIVLGRSKFSLSGHMSWHSKKNNQKTDRLPSEYKSKIKLFSKASKKVLTESKFEVRSSDYVSIDTVKEEISSDLEDNKESLYPLISEIEIKEEVF